MVKYNEIIFWTEDEMKFDKVRSMLRNEYGLVKPMNDSFRSDNDILVWEDKLRIGRYKVHFLPKYKEGKSAIYFRYWIYRMTPEIREADPMLPVVQKVYELLKPVDRICSCAAGIVIKELGDQCP